MSDTAVELDGPGSGPADTPPSRSRLRLADGVAPGHGPFVGRAVLLLDEDRALAAAMPQEHARRLAPFLRAEVLSLPAGKWRPDAVQMREDGAMGLLVLDGLLIRSLAFGTRRSAELLGPGDLLRPWDSPGEAGVCVTTAADWRVWKPARVALLDRRVAAAIGRSPELAGELMSRLVRRMRLLAVLLALTQVRQLRQRVLLALWTLAERWGRVTPDGVALTVPLTHATLAQLSGASRPSVTKAVADLRADGLVLPTGKSRWLLLGDSPGAVDSGFD